MHYKHRNATHWQRLQGVYSEKGYEAALEVYKKLPKTSTVQAWRVMAFGQHYWLGLAGLCVPVVLWWLG
ncbi:hypothetical protein D3C78_1850520 [compost metagenome]